MLYYCKKCGRIVIHHDKIEKIYNCDCCKSELHKVPTELYESHFDFLGHNNPKAEKLREELVKTSPEFDQYLFDHRDEILAKQSAELNAKMAIGKTIMEEQSRVPKCPSCGSTNISKIGVVNRVVSTHFLGLGSSKIGKTHKCNNCGTTW